MSQTNNKYKQLESLFSESKPADPNPSVKPVNSETEALKAKLASLQAELDESHLPKLDKSLYPTQALNSELQSQPVSEIKQVKPAPAKVEDNPTLWNRIRRFFSAPVFDDAKKTESAKLLYQIISVIWGLPVLLVVIMILNESGRAEVIPPAIVISTILLSLMIVIRRGWIGFANSVLTAMIILVFAYADFNNAGNIQPSTLVTAIAIIMSGLLLGRRAPLIAAGLIAITHGTIVFLEMQGVIVLKSAPALGFENIIITGIMILMIGFLFQFVISRLHFSLEQTLENERALQISNRELQTLGASLEVRVADRTHDLELASEVGRTIAEKVGNVYDMLSGATEMIRSRFNLYYTQVYLLDVSGQTITLRSGTGSVGQQLLQRGHRLQINSNSLNGRAAFEKNPVIVSDTTKDPSFLPNPLLPKTRSEMAIPLLIGNKLLGVLDMQSEYAGSLNQENLPAFQVLAGQISVAIQNANLFAESEEARKQLEANVQTIKQGGWLEFLNGVDRNERFGYVFDQKEVLPLTETQTLESNNALVMPIQVTGASVGEVRFTDETHRNWTESEKQIVEAILAQAAQHIDSIRLLSQAEQYRSEAQQVSRRLTREGWEAYMQNREQLSEGYAYDLNSVLPLSASNNGHKSSALAHPLTVRDEIIGQFTIDAKENLSDDMNEILRAVAAQLGEQIERLRLSEQNEKRAYELATVATVSTTASTVLNPDELLQAVVNLTKERFNLYHTHIYLADYAANVLALAAGAGEVGQQMVVSGHSIPMEAEKSLVARAAREQEPVLVNDVRSEADFLPNPLLAETRSEMAVPMIVGDNVLGVFDVQSNVVSGFSKEDADIYTTLAAQVAIALQNARLYVEQASTVTQLRELDRLKSSFLANMSHELRTPLNSILGFADVMLEELDGPLTDTMENDLGLIQKNGQHLLHLINDVLDMAKIEAGRMNLLPEKFRLHETLEEVIGITSGLASDKKLGLAIDKNSDQQIEVTADRTRIRQVMINLVNNAIKFTESGKVSIHVKTLPNSMVSILVKDTGIGIPPDKLEAVFQEFTQVDTSTTRKIGGTGLGLPISRRLIQMHGGSLWAESTGISGEGATFHIELPIEAIIAEPVEELQK